MILRKGDVAEFTFDCGTAPAGDMVRDYIVVVKGRYEPDPSIYSHLLPTTSVLYGNYPNPLRGETRIVFDLPDQATVHVELYDLLGRKVTATAPKPMQAGLEQSISLRIPDLPAGTYFYRLIAVGGSANREAAGELVVTR